MRKVMIFPVSVLCGLLMQACQSKPGATDEAQVAVQDTSVLSGRMADCRVEIEGLTFTQALGRADTCVTVRPDGVLEFECGEKRDIFCDPNGKLSNNSLPILLTAVDNSRPFTLTAKVTPGFTDEGLYNAADLFVYANDTLWQKLCYEQDERGNHRVVTVRTRGTSDDNNHQQLDVASVYLRISSDSHTLASYYSLDKEEWHMVRLYKNDYPAELWLGVASQCPQKGICTSLFSELSLTQDAVGDFRTGD